MKKYSWIVLLLAFFGIFMTRNFLIPLLADDYAYSFVWTEKYGNLMDFDKMPNEVPDFKRVESFSDLIKSNYNHYFNWGARPLAVGILQTFLIFDKSFFNVANSIIFIALILLMYSLSQKAQGLKDISFGRLLWLIFALWFCLPEISITMLWECGSCNYLWMTLIQCVFLIPYAKRYNDRDYNFSLPLIMILGFLAGCTNEGGGVGLFFLTAIFTLRSMLRHEKINFMLAGFIAFCAGFAFIILAPGNANRFVLTEKFLSYDLGYSIDNLYSAEMFFINFMWGFLPTILDQLPAYAVIIAYLWQNRKSKDDFYGYVLIFSFSALMIPCACMFSPEFPSRAAFASSIFIIIASCSAISRIRMPGRKFLIPVGILGTTVWGLSFMMPEAIYITSTSIILMSALFVAIVRNSMSEKKVLDILKATAALFLIFDISFCLIQDVNFYEQSSKRLTLIEQQKDKDLVEVPELKTLNLPYFTEVRAFDIQFIIDNTDILKSPYYHHNLAFAAYYGLKQITITED